MESPGPTRLILFPEENGQPGLQTTEREPEAFNQMTGYTKLFNSIITSTIWCEDNTTRIVWITMLALKNQDHVVEGSVPGLAAMARVTVDDCARALNILKSPDLHSRTKEFEGRRIEECDGGWRLLNGEQYRQKMNMDDRREYFRVKQQERRARQAVKEMSKMSNLSKTVKDKSTPSTQSYSESESYSDLKEKSTHKIGAAEPPAKPGTAAARLQLVREGLCAMFDRALVDHWSYAEESALVDVVKRANCAQELAELRKYQRENGKFFARTVVALVTDWTKYLDSARTFAREPSNKPAKTTAQKDADKLLRDIQKL